MAIVREINEFQFSTPRQFFPSPERPGVQADGVDNLSKHFDIHLSFDSTDSEKLRATLSSQQKKEALRNQAGAFDIVCKIIDTEKSEMFDTIITLTKDNRDKFIEFMKYSCINYITVLKRIAPVPFNDERTFFIEIVQPYLTYFGAHTRLLSFQWCEKQLRAVNIWYVDNDYSYEGPRKKFLDGIGHLATPDLPVLLIGSSGYNQANVSKHALTDTLKQIKNATNALKYIISKYMDARYATLKKVKVFTVQVIQQKMTLISTNIKSPTKWEVIECRSCELPTKYDERFFLMNVFEFFAFLFEEINDQIVNYEKLQKEHLGVTQIQYSDTIREVLFTKETESTENMEL